MISDYLRKINSFFKYYFYFFKNYKLIKNSKSFSQEGEDKFLLEYFKDRINGFYIDVGAFHPYRINNTYLLYKKGFRGINIDISATSIDFFDIARPDHINLNVGAPHKIQKKFFFLRKICLFIILYQNL